MGIKPWRSIPTPTKARHVALADEAVHIGPPSRESYLQADKIIAAAKQTGAQAIHPGYGFLSKTRTSPSAWTRGITFIGPKHYSIAAMGDKIAIKNWPTGAGQHHPGLERRH